MLDDIFVGKIERGAKIHSDGVEELLGTLLRLVLQRPFNAHLAAPVADGALLFRLLLLLHDDLLGVLDDLVVLA